MKTLHPYFLAVFFCLGLATNALCADTYVIDAVHSSVAFSIKHLTVSEVIGNFKNFSGLINIDPKNSAITEVEASIETKSVNTQNEQRDEHLRGTDFFDADTNPAISFKSTSVKTQGNVSTVTGELTIKGTTKTISLPLTIAGPVKSPMNDDQVIGVSGQTKINRPDFGVKWNKQMDQGGYVIADEVLITINLEAHKKTPPVEAQTEELESDKTPDVQ